MTSHHKLKSLTVKGYKSIADQTVPIAELNILIGQNGAGKTNFISLFEFLKDIIDANLQYTVKKAGGADQILYYGSRTTRTMEVVLDFSYNLYNLRLASTANDSLFIVSETCGSMGDMGNLKAPIWHETTRANDESLLSKSREEIDKNVYEELKGWRVYHFHDTSETAGVKKYSSVSDNRFLFEDASNLAAFTCTVAYPKRLL